MSALLFSISSTSLLSKPETNSDSNDGHTHTPNPTNPRLSRVTAPSSSLCSQGKAERGSQPVRRPCSPHQFTESRRQPCILTSLALTSSRGRGGGRSKRGDRSRGGTEGVSSCRNDTTPDCVRDHCCYFILGPNLAVRLEAHYSPQRGSTFAAH